MKIGIEAERANSEKKTGVEHYAQQLIEHLAAYDTENSYILYLRTKPQAWFFSLPENFEVKVIPFPIFWTQLRLSWEMLIHPVDVLFIPASALPLWHPKKTVVTIHDLAWRFFPETFTWFNRNFLKLSTWFAIHSATRIIAVSEATKKDLILYYQIPLEKVIVVHHGYSLADQIINGSENSDFAKASLDKQAVVDLFPRKYILFLSTLQPRKNLERLITAFVELKKELPQLVHKLVVVGKPGWKYESILRAIEQNKNYILYLNHVSEQQKVRILTHADLLVLPSLYEGFGMQILEAFAAGVPVATAKISSMPEVAGNAAVYFNPLDFQDMKKAIQHVLLDAALKESLQQLGKERLKKFNWEKCAQQTYEVLTHIL